MHHDINHSELILNADGSVYHLGLLPEDLADTIILVGDQDRVPMVSSHFDTIEIIKRKREFVTHTGLKNGLRLSAMSTGIGTDNIDIVLNEINLLKNADLKNRRFTGQYNNVRLIRVGTSGGVDPLINPGSFLMSTSAIGLDGMAVYYGTEAEEAHAFVKACNWPAKLAVPYLSHASETLVQLFRDIPFQGTTLTTQGFYRPQGRNLESGTPTVFTSTELNQAGIKNIEMETAAIYLLSMVFGFEAVSLNAILANRSTGKFSANPSQVIRDLITWTLDHLG